MLPREFEHGSSVRGEPGALLWLEVGCGVWQELGLSVGRKGALYLPCQHQGTAHRLPLNIAALRPGDGDPRQLSRCELNVVRVL